jgi:outer membrane protein TolC
VGATVGCQSSKFHDKATTELCHYQQVATQIEYPTVATPCDASLLNTPEPLSLEKLSKLPPESFESKSLQEATRQALMHSRVLQDLGGTVLRAPETVQTNYAVAVTESDPQFGPEAALSAFDADFNTSLFFEKNDRKVNNSFVGNLGIFQQDYDVAQVELAKRSVTGTQLALRHIVDYDRDNNLGDLFKSGAYDAILEGEVRHPFLRGGGVEFNRIAGPGARPGVYNGVLVARVRTDISLADFEIGVRDFVSNVENAYWDLYFAYRDLDTKVQARDTALETWRKVKASVDQGRLARDAEAQAREQYFRFREDVQNALVGRLLDGTHTYDGSTPGTFRGNPGVQVAERRLRLLMGLPPTDPQSKLLRPSEEPTMANVSLDWRCLAAEALTRREELRRQRWVVKGRELELIAAKNFLLPSLDMVGRYRWRGFGRELIDTNRNHPERFDNAYADLTRGDFQEWQLGAEFSMPLGFRQGHAAVRNAELRVSQARAMLREQERQVVSDLSNAVSEKDRAYTVLQTDINHVLAAQTEVGALEAVFNEQGLKLFEMLDAQRRRTDALVRYHQGRVEYALAIRNVHMEAGSLLEYCEISLTEGPWPNKAYRDAARRDRWRGRPHSTDYAFHSPPIVSMGPMPPCTACPEGQVAPSGPMVPAQPGPVGMPPGNGPPNPPDVPAEPPVGPGAAATPVPGPVPQPPAAPPQANDVGPRESTEPNGAPHCTSITTSF